MQRIIIIGEGFAGVFAALAAAGERHRSKQGAGITVELLSPARISRLGRDSTKPS